MKGQKSKTIKNESSQSSSGKLLYPVLIFMTAFSFYFNSISNDFALDDLIVITGNQYTQKGISGIADIMTHDAFVGAYGEALNLTGGQIGRAHV